MGRPKKDAPNRADGLYEVKVTIGKDFSGKLIRKSFYSTVSKADARAKAEQYKIDHAVYEATFYDCRIKKRNVLGFYTKDIILLYSLILLILVYTLTLVLTHACVKTSVNLLITC